MTVYLIYSVIFGLTDFFLQLLAAPPIGVSLQLSEGITLTPVHYKNNKPFG
jgi:hypothetical protein